VAEAASLVELLASLGGDVWQAHAEAAPVVFHVLAAEDAQRADADELPG